MQRTREEIKKLAKAMVARVLAEAMARFDDILLTVHQQIDAADWEDFMKTAEEEAEEALLNKFSSSD